MGILKKIKQMFSKNIDCADKLENKMFYFYTTKNRTITVGANIIVPEGYNAVFVCKDKVTDIVPKGKFAISAINLPKTFKRLKLEKKSKKGKVPKNFVADLYFLTSNNVENLKFSSYTPYKSKCERLGIVKAHSEGFFNIKILEPDKLLSYMLLERAYITEDLFLDLLGGMVGDYVNKVLQTSDKSFYDLILNPQYCTNYIAEQLALYNYFDDLGVEVSNIKIDFLKVNSRLKEKVENEMSNQKKFTIKLNPIQTQNVEVSTPKLKETENVEIDKNESKDNINKEYKICTNCGKKINAEAVFCERCGVKISKF